MKKYSFQVFADYSQVLLHDEAWESDFSEAWNDDAYRKMVVASDEALAISTARNMDVQVEIIVSGDKPSIDFADWDHIIQCNLGLSSGTLVVRGISDYLPDSAKIELEPGQYIVWALYGDLNTVSDDGLEGKDHYRVILCRSDAITPLEVLKSKN